MRTQVLASVALASLGFTALAPATGAQVPYGYVLVSESTAFGPALSALGYLQVPGGAFTPIRATGNLRANTLLSPLALDPNDPQSIYGRPGIAASLTLVYIVTTVQGSEAVATRQVSLSPLVGIMQRVHVTGSDLLFTIGGTIANSGLWRVPLAGGQPVQLVQMANARDIAVFAGKAYVHNFVTATPTQVVEVDLATRATRVVSSTLPTVLSMTPFNNALLVGTEGGDLGLVTLATGAYQIFLSPNRGPVVSVIVPPPGLPVFATAREVYRVPNFTTPIYVATNTIVDLEGGVHDLASQIFYGEGCDGSNGRRPRPLFTGLPSLGNSAFRLAITDARPTAPAALLIGVQRRSLDLGPFGMPGCTLLADPLLAVAFMVDAQGGGSIPLGVPNDPGLKGGHLTAQAAIVDPAANPAGVATGAGSECIVR
jgi:hypothetical protein